jgi:putative transposase
VAHFGRIIWLTYTYHHRVHPETGQTPLARWSAGDWLPRTPDSLEALNLLLLTEATPRKEQRDGIHCHGLRYFSITLAPYVGEEPFTIRYDPRDLAEIRVYHRGKFLCRAVSPDIASVTVSLQDLQAARNQRRRELRQPLTTRRSLVEPAHPTQAGVGRWPDDPEEEPGRGLREPGSHPAEAVPRRLTPQDR